MGLIKDIDRYPLDSTISNEDRLVGTDADDQEITKSFSVADLIAFMSTQIDGTSQDNLFQEIDLGFMDSDESVSALANALASYTITETGLVLYTVTINAEADGEDQVLSYVTVLRGKGNYGIGGTTLNDGDFYLINPVQLETVRNSLVIQSLIVADKILFGDITWSGTGLIFEATNYDYIIGGQLYSADPNLAITLDVGDADPRIDVIALNTDGDFVIIKGTASGSPIKPSLTDFDTQIEITSVSVGALATTPTNISNELIFNEDVGESAEWTMTENTGAVRIVFDAVSDPYLGATHIYATGILDADAFTATNDATVAHADFTELALNIKIDSRLKRGSRILVAPYDGATQVAASVAIRGRAFGFRSGYTAGYQTVIIPMKVFGWKADDFDNLVFTFNGFDVSHIVKIDNIRLVSGTDPSNALDIPTHTSDLVNDGSDGINPFISSADVTLQTVLDGGSLAGSLDGLSQFVMSESEGGGYFQAILYASGFSKNSEIYADEDNILIKSNGNSGDSHTIRLINGVLTLEQTNSGDTTIVGYTTPTADITVNFPTKPIGTYTLTTNEQIDDTVFGVSWDGNQDAATKNAIYDIVQEIRVLEIIDEGNGDGIVLFGRTAANYGNVGFLAKDLSISYGASSVYGATGEASVSFAEDSEVSGYGAFGLTGWEMALTGAYTIGGGYQNVSNGYASVIFGAFNTETSSTGFSFTQGNGNVNDQNSGFVAGVAILKGIGVGCFVAGTANVNITSTNNGTDVLAPMFIFGNGTHTTGVGVPWAASVRSNLLVGLRNGEITAPSTTIAVIDGEATGKILVTREWADAQMTLDAVTTLGNSTSNDIFVNKLWTFDIQNNDTGNLLISGNQSLVLRSHNPATGEVLITSNGAIGSLSNDEDKHCLRISRLYNDSLTTSNNEFYGINIADTVNLTTKTGAPLYAGIYINPAVTGGGDIRAIYSKQGDAIFEGGEVEADGFRTPSGVVTKTVKVSLSASEVENIGTTPITAVAAQGAGTVIKVISAFAVLTYGSVAFTNNVLLIKTSGATNNQITLANFLNATADINVTSTIGAFTDTLVTNSALVIDGTDSGAAGDSPVDVYITYEIVTL